jgi:hypothetical protein
LYYKDGADKVVVRKLSAEEYKGGGYVYEVNFLPEDVQELYEIELWGQVDAADAGAVSGGVYREVIQFNIEVTNF